MKVLICFVILLSMVGTHTTFCNAVGEKPIEDSRELQLQDMLVLLLLPQMREKLAEVYSNVLSAPGSPDIYPYFVDVTHTERLNGFRGFDFLITQLPRSIKVTETIVEGLASRQLLFCFLKVTSSLVLQNHLMRQLEVW